MACYVLIGEDINNDQLVEIPSERDGTLLLSCVVAQFPGAVGLRYKSQTGCWRGLRTSEGFVAPPPDGWGSRAYYIVRDGAQKPTTQAPKPTVPAAQEKQLISKEVEDANNPYLKKYMPDLMIAEVPFEASDEELKEYFENFGPLETFNMLKKDGKRRGFGFLKYRTSAATKKALETSHYLYNRPMVIRFTKLAREMLQMGYGVECMPDDKIHTKLYVGKLPLDATPDELGEVFRDYIPLVDVWISPGKGYGFVTFTSVANAFRAMNAVHVLRGQHLVVNMPDNKKQLDVLANNDPNTFDALAQGHKKSTQNPRMPTDVGNNPAPLMDNSSNSAMGSNTSNMDKNKKSSIGSNSDTNIGRNAGDKTGNHANPNMGSNNATNNMGISRNIGMGNNSSNNMGNNAHNTMGNTPYNSMGNNSNNNMGISSNNNFGNSGNNNMGNMTNNNFGNMANNNFGNSGNNNMGNNANNNLGNNGNNNMGNNAKSNVYNNRNNNMDSALNMGITNNNPNNTMGNRPMGNNMNNSAGNNMNSNMGNNTNNTFGNNQPNPTQPNSSLSSTHAMDKWVAEQVEAIKNKDYTDKRHGGQSGGKQYTKTQKRRARKMRSLMNDMNQLNQQSSLMQNLLNPGGIKPEDNQNKNHEPHGRQGAALEILGGMQRATQLQKNGPGAHGASNFGGFNSYGGASSGFQGPPGRPSGPGYGGNGGMGYQWNYGR